MDFDENQLKALKDNFRTVYKRIQRYENSRPLTTDVSLLAQYKQDIVQVYNAIRQYCVHLYALASTDDKTKIEEVYQWSTSYLKKALFILQLEYTFKEGWNLIDISRVTQISQIASMAVNNL